MGKRKLIKSVSIILLIPGCLWADLEQPENFRLTRDHSGFVEGIEGNVCKDFLDVINRIPDEKLLPCHTPDFSGSPFTLVQFTPLDSKRQIEYGKILYHRDNGTEAYQNAWPEKEKEYETGYSRLLEAFLDLDGDGVKEHVIEQQMPNKFCVPSIEGDALKTRKAWDSLSKSEQLAAANKYGYMKFYGVVTPSKKYKAITLVDSVIWYQNRFFSFDMTRLDYININENWGGREWVTLEKIYRDKKENHVERRNICKFWLEK